MTEREPPIVHIPRKGRNERYSTEEKVSKGELLPVEAAVKSLEEQFPWLVGAFENERRIRG